MEDRAQLATRRAARPETFGDFLRGLFVLAREEVLEAVGLLAAVDSVLAGMDVYDFFVALPGLRLAFGFFPPAEKERLARTLVTLHGGDPGPARSLVAKLSVPAEETAAGMRLDAEVTRLAREYGLDDGEYLPQHRSPESVSSTNRVAHTEHAHSAQASTDPGVPS